MKCETIERQEIKRKAEIRNTRKIEKVQETKTRNKRIFKIDDVNII